MRFASLLAGIIAFATAAFIGWIPVANAYTEPLTREYACADGGFGDCRTSTPAFDSCAAWGAWFISTVPPDGQTRTVREAIFNSPFGGQGLQCLVETSTGALSGRSIDNGHCSTSTDTVSGPDVFNRVCTGTGPRVTRQMGPCGRAENRPNCNVGDPINHAPSVGNKYESIVDYAGTGPFPLKLERVYNSGANQFMPGRYSQAFALSNWIHSYERRVSLMVRNGTSYARVDRPDGSQFYFTLVGSAWVAQQADIADRLERVAENSVTIWKYTNLSDEVERYDDVNGRLTSITNRAGLAQVLAYDSLNRLVTVTDPLGKTLTFNYGAANCSGGRCVASVRDPNANLIQYGYDTINIGGNNVTRLRTVTYPGITAAVTYNYWDDQNPYLLLSVIDQNGATTASWTYDNPGSARANISQRAGGVEKVSLVYQSTTSTQATFDIAAGVTRVNTYGFQTIQGMDRMVSVGGGACPSCGPAAQTYDTNGFVASRTDWNGNRTNYTNNTLGLQTLRVEGLTSAGATTSVTRTITTEWHASYRLPTRVAEPLRITTMSYGAPNDTNPGNRGSLLTKTVQATTDANGSLGFSAIPTGTARTWTYTYNTNGQVLTVNGPRTDVSDLTTYTYYSNTATCTATVTGASTTGCRGQINTITNALNHITTINEYNAHGQPLKVTDPNTLVTTLGYDARLRLTSRNVGGEVTTYTYDNAGQLTQVTLPDTSFLSYTYDAAHRLTQIADNVGNRIAYTLDLMGNRTAEQVYDPANVLAQTRSRVYSSLNRLSQEIGAASQTTTYAYDNQGNVTSIDGPLSGAVDVTTNTYDALNRLIRVTDPASGQVNYGYSGLDRLVSVSDPRNLTTTYSYDGLNNLNQLASPDTGTTVNVYDAAGNLITSTDAKNQVTSYVYDALNRVTSITYQGSIAHTYQYDQGTYGKGRLTQISEPNSTTQHAYDQKGRLTTETRTIAGVQYVTRYGYDAVGRLVSLSYPSGREVTYLLDSLGRIQQVATTRDSTTQTVVSAVAYRPFGAARSFTFGNGQSYTRGFDQDGRIASYTLATQTLAVGYDPASRITSLAGSTTNTFGYDALDRLTSFIGPSLNQAFTYDAVSNRATKTVGASTANYSYASNSNRLSTITGATNRTYSYDANGSATADGTGTFAYDARGRLSQAVNAALTTDYKVNALGQRIRKTNSEGDTVYHYDAQGRLIAESNSAGAPLKEYIYLGDIPVAVLQ